MSSHEYRAWLTLWSMCPAYAVYFVIQAAFPALLPGMRERIVCLAATAGVHAVLYLAGYMRLKLRRPDGDDLPDERDRAIDARATRAAYFLLLIGMLLVGVVMPFGHARWELVNAALLFVVLSETLRSSLIVISYRRSRFAH